LVDIARARRKEQEVVHPLLQIWSRLTDDLDVGTSITLFVGGQIITGRMISTQRYIAGTGAELAERFKKGDRLDLAESFMAALEAAMKSQTQEGKRYVYLQDAKVGKLSFNYMAFALEDIDGFAF
jgi:hypothetical protein